MEWPEASQVEVQRLVTGGGARVSATQTEWGWI